MQVSVDYGLVFGLSLLLPVVQRMFADHSQKEDPPHVQRIVHGSVRIRIDNKLWDTWKILLAEGQLGLYCHLFAFDECQWVGGRKIPLMVACRHPAIDSGNDGFLFEEDFEMSIRVPPNAGRIDLWIKISGKAGNHGLILPAVRQAGYAAADLLDLADERWNAGMIRIQI